MKKIISVLISCLFILSIVPSLVSAEEADLPFELVAPANVTAVWLEENDSPTTTKIAYSLSNEMTTFFKNVEKAHEDGTIEDLMAEYGVGDIAITTQVDWALDDVDDPVSGWHCNEYWKRSETIGSFGYDDDGNIRVSEWDGVDLWVGNATQTVNEHWVTRGLPNDERWCGNPDTKTPGVKDQLNPDQYTYDEDANDGEGVLRIDFDEHTMYFRMRFAVTTYKDTDDGTVSKDYYSDWSDVASIGKDAEKFESLKPGDLAAPVISGLRLTDKTNNGFPVVAFTLTVPDELAKKATEVTSVGGTLWVETEARVAGDEEWATIQGDWTVKAGEMECDLGALLNEERTTVDENTPVELRCRYYYAAPDEDPFTTDWSEPITFATAEINRETQAAPETTASLIETAPIVEQKEPEKEKCPLCHFCPQPLGLCIFVWILIILIIAAVVIVIVLRRKKIK